MVFTGEADRVFGKNFPIRGKAHSQTPMKVGLVFESHFFFVGHAKKEVTKVFSGTSLVDKEIAWAISPYLGVNMKMQYLEVRRVATMLITHRQSGNWSIECSGSAGYANHGFSNVSLFANIFLKNKHIRIAFND